LPFDPTGSAEIAGLLQTGIALPLDLDGVANNAGIAQVRPMDVYVPSNYPDGDSF
jgi:hypothetical protein